MKKIKIASILIIFAFIISCGSVDIKSTSDIPYKPKLKVGLVLGAGAAKGFAHVGVLKVLEKNKIPVDIIVGTSVGSFVGALYSYGYNAEQIEKMAYKLEKTQITDITFPSNGFIEGEALQRYVNNMVRDTPLEKMKIPFYVVTTDLYKGEEVVFGKGNTGIAVRASCAVPGVFQPVNIGSKVYVDGGVVSPVAVSVARKYGADIVIAVDISSSIGTPENSTIGTIMQSIDIMYSKIAGYQLSQADIIIKPDISYISSSDFEKKREAILAGEKSAYQVLPKIKEVLNRY